MNKSMFDMDEDEFEAHLRASAHLSAKQKKARWNKLNNLGGHGEDPYSKIRFRMECERAKVQSEISGDFENESPM